jgi:hypothetical protein
MSAIEKLTEGIVSRDLGQEGAALLNKWESTGLLEGLGNDVTKNNMARLLENQAKQLLKEASTMSGGDVEGFSAVAFPIVRRVFGELIANELVSVQPMSLPSGLIFFLDFTVNNAKLGYGTDQSLYGGGKVASEITGGIDLTNVTAANLSEAGPYALNNGYAAATASVTVATTMVSSGTYHGPDVDPGDIASTTADAFRKALRYDPDIASGTHCAVCTVPVATLRDAGVNMDNLVALSNDALTTGRIARRLTRIDPDNTDNVIIVAAATGSETLTTMGTALDALAALDAPVEDNFIPGGALGSVVGTTTAPGWALEASANIAEIDIKVDSVAVTAVSKKLKAKWSPELGQDLNAYHNLDAEVELTSILSEQIALEIDQEILNDLIQGAAKGAGVRYWSRKAGKFVNRTTGAEIGASGTPDFTGTVSEWYETLLESINDVSAEIHRRTIRGGANFIVCSPEVANILEFTAGFRANVAVDANGTAGAMNVGSISKKLDVYVDPYFPRNVILVGRRGNSFLESGYVYAPYVPLQVTPTIFGVEDFVPRKGVMTRYAKKMVRPDMYGLVICQDVV